MKTQGRFFLEADFDIDEVYELSKEESHHGIEVLRFKKKSETQYVELLNGKGQSACAELLGIEKSRAKLKIIKVKNFTKFCNLVLVQAIVKNTAMDTIVKNATEIGATAIFPVITENSVVKITESNVQNKLSRWQKIAIAAVKQCGNAFLPEIFIPINLPELHERFELSCYKNFFGSLESDAPYFTNVFKNNFSEENNFIIGIGPEGDFSQSEIGYLKSHNFAGVKLCDNVLRSDTASTYFLSLINHQLLSNTIYRN